MKLFSALYDCPDPWGHFDEVIGCTSPDQLHTEGCLLLHGGEDISPSLYGQIPSKWTSAKSELSKRDKREVAFVKRATQLGIPIIGICRGAQLLCAMAGGSVIQDVSGHEWGKHDLVTEDGEYQMTNSIHHQMMNVEGSQHHMIAWTDPKLSKYYVGNKEEEIDIPMEPEIVHFPQLRALAIQGHPEYLTSVNPFVQFTLRKAKQYVL
jgi:GMP synthase-like glutamine amidotransferase